MMVGYAQMLAALKQLDNFGNKSTRNRLPAKHKTTPAMAANRPVKSQKIALSPALWLPSSLSYVLWLSTVPGLQHGLVLDWIYPFRSPAAPPPNKQQILYKRPEGWKGVSQIHVQDRLITIFAAHNGASTLATIIASSRVVIPFHRRHILLERRASSLQVEH